ncbi:hypothetical protein GCM10020227_34270 [Streptomyces flavovirens]
MIFGNAISVLSVVAPDNDRGGLEGKGSARVHSLESTASATTRLSLNDTVTK